MSKFIKKLEAVGQSTPIPMGFGSRTQMVGTPAVLLVGLLSVQELQEAPSLAQSPVDALLIKSNLSELNLLSDIFTQSAGLLWGLRLDETSAKEVEKVREMGCDFLVFDAEGASADILQDQETGKVLTIDMTLEEGMARAIEDSLVDAVLLVPIQEILPLTVQRLLEIQSVRTLVAKPFLIEISAPPGGKGLECLRDADISGVVMSLSQGGEVIQRVRQEIDSIPRRKPKAERPGAIIPRLSPGLGTARPRREEEEEEEEE
ncbi:MAG: hypothetical protein HY666_04300 [Chloroflexi bacterium]|nr:hypothetical protein [Chloroflexota bacterium]